MWLAERGYTASVLYTSTARLPVGVLSGSKSIARGRWWIHVSSTALQPWCKSRWARGSASLGEGAPGSRSTQRLANSKGRYIYTSRAATADFQRSHSFPMQLVMSPIHNHLPISLHVCFTLAPPSPYHLLTIQRPSCRPTLTAVKPPHLYHQRYDSFALSAGLPNTRNPASFVTATFLRWSKRSQTLHQT